MAITRTAMIDDDGSGLTGTPINNAWKQELYNQIDALAGAPWVDVAYVAGNFTTSGGGSWTVPSQLVYAYQITGKTLTVALYLSGTTIGGAPVGLSVQLPFAPSRGFGQPYNFSFSGGSGSGFSTPTGITLNLYRDLLATPWAAGPAHVAGVLHFSLA